MTNSNQLRKYFLGFNIGGTKCSVVLGDENFSIYEKIERENTSIARLHPSHRNRAIFWLIFGKELV